MECPTLFDLLSKYSLVLHQISPYLSVASLLDLAATSKAFRSLVFGNKETFRYLDLSTATGAYIAISPIDRGGFNWRNERIDESTTEEDFYSGPIRGIFSFLQRKNVLATIQVLVLDHVSAPVEVLSEIIREEQYQVRILSVIGSTNLNAKKLQQALRYAVRPTRPPGTPKLKGLYIFGINQRPSLIDLVTLGSTGVTDSPGAQLGAALNRKSHSALQSSGLAANISPWYRNSGKVLGQSMPLLNDWAMTMKECQDIIYFDAILCRGPRHDAMSSIVTANSKDFIGPRVATIALRGCEICHSLPEGAARSNQAPSSNLPLLSPVPRHSSSIKVAQQPPPLQSSSHPLQQDQLLFARCAECAIERWCEGCGKFWCEDHYHIQDSQIESDSSSNKSTARLKEAAATACGDEALASAEVETETDAKVNTPSFCLKTAASSVVANALTAPPDHELSRAAVASVDRNTALYILMRVQLTRAIGVPTLVDGQGICTNETHIRLGRTGLWAIQGFLARIDGKDGIQDVQDRAIERNGIEFI